jgi:hypothetical protein
MVISVPVGYRVHVIVTSKGAYPHNAVVTATNPRQTTGTVSLAFRGAGPSDTASGVEALRFTFVAGKVGTYYLVCGVPGHASAGMWDWFKVTRGGQALPQRPAPCPPAPGASDGSRRCHVG